MSLEEVFNAFSFLRNMLSNEFILSPGATVQVRKWIQTGGAEIIELAIQT